MFASRRYKVAEKNNLKNYTWVNVLSYRPLFLIRWGGSKHNPGWRHFILTGTREAWFGIFVAIWYIFFLPYHSGCLLMPILTYAHILHSVSWGGNIFSCLLLLWGPSGRCRITTLSKIHTFTGQNKKLPSQHFDIAHAKTKHLLIGRNVHCGPMSISCLKSLKILCNIGQHLLCMLQRI